MFGEHALAFATARPRTHLASSLLGYRYASSCLNGNHDGDAKRYTYVTRSLQTTGASASNIKSRSSHASCSGSPSLPSHCTSYCYAVLRCPVLAVALLAVCFSFAPAASFAQEANTREDPSSQREGTEAGRLPQKIPQGLPLGEKIDILEGQVIRMAEDFKDLSHLAKDGESSGAPNAPSNASWIAVMAKLQERLRVIEHTLTDLTARTEQLERFGVKRADGTSVAGGDGENTDKQGLFDKANDLLRGRKVEQAIEAFKKFVENYPSDERIAEVMFYLGESYAVMQDDKKAADAFLNGYKKNRKGPLAPKLLLRLGQTLAKLGKDKQACRVLKEFKKYFAKKDEQLDAIVESEIVANACSAS